VYTWAGDIQFWLNGDLVMNYSTERPPVPGASYWAVVDVCFSAASMTLLPSEEEARPLAKEPPIPEVQAAVAEKPRGIQCSLRMPASGSLQRSTFFQEDLFEVKRKERRCDSNSSISTLASFADRGLTWGPPPPTGRPEASRRSEASSTQTWDIAEDYDDDEDAVHTQEQGAKATSSRTAATLTASEWNGGVGETQRIPACAAGSDAPCLAVVPSPDALRQGGRNMAAFAERCAGAAAPCLAVVPSPDALTQGGRKTASFAERWAGADAPCLAVVSSPDALRQGGRKTASFAERWAGALVLGSCVVAAVVVTRRNLVSK